MKRPGTNFGILRVHHFSVLGLLQIEPWQRPIWYLCKIQSQHPCPHPRLEALGGQATGTWASRALLTSNHYHVPESYLQNPFGRNYLSGPKCRQVDKEGVPQLVDAMEDSSL